MVQEGNGQPLATEGQQLSNDTGASSDVQATLPPIEEAAVPEGAGAAGAETQQRLRSEEEFRRFQSQMDRQLNAERQARQQAEQQYAMMMLEQERQRDVAFLQRTQTEGGDVNAAQRIVQEREGLRQQQFQTAMQQRQVAEQMDRVSQLDRLQGMQIFAQHFGLKTEDFADCRTPQEAHIKALTLSQRKAQAQQRPLLKIDSGVVSGKGYSPQSVAKAYADGRIDTATYERYMRSLGREPG